MPRKGQRNGSSPLFGMRGAALVLLASLSALGAASEGDSAVTELTAEDFDSRVADGEWLVELCVQPSAAISAALTDHSLTIAAHPVMRRGAVIVSAWHRPTRLWRRS